MSLIPRNTWILTAQQMGAVEQQAFDRGVAQADLMERAGLAVAHLVRRLSPPIKVIVLAGPGNNGGDAYVAARHLADWGYDVLVAALGKPKQGVAAEMAARWAGQTIPVADLPLHEGDYILVDGLFGSGTVRDLDRAPLPINHFTCAKWGIAIDMPSWLDGDSGEFRWGWIHAQRNLITLALGALKPAHVLKPWACGELLIEELGLCYQIKDWFDLHSALPTCRTIGQPFAVTPGHDSNKYRAKVTIVSGAMPGAARLAARGAAGAGAGYVQLVGDPQRSGPLDAIVHRPIGELEAMLADPRPGTLLVGPGLGRDADARRILDMALAAKEVHLILDGDALTLLGIDAVKKLRDRDYVTLTPHEAEFNRMFGENVGNKIERTLAASEAIDATIVHKGSTTVIGRQGEKITVSTQGSTWLAAAGTGDVLAGAVAVRGGEDAVWLHARASHLAGPAFSADRLADCLPLAMAECR
jgi:hydroxyethylthiazole kinase-like uncharacterized protein yjeF